MKTSIPHHTNTAGLRRAAFIVLSLLVLGLTPFSAHAGLIGTQVTGAMYIGATNYYDPANGYVPAGYGNSMGTTVTIAEPLVEFGYMDGANTDTTNFTNLALTYTDVCVSNSVPLTFTFTDPAFVGATFTAVSDSFPNGGVTGTLVGDQITLLTPELGAAGTFSVTYTVSAVPEPSTWALVAMFGLCLPVAVKAGRRQLAK